VNLAIQFAASLAAILALAGVAHWLKLGGDVRILDEDHARALADQFMCGFAPVDIIIDRARIGALLRDAQGRHLVIRRHGAMFAGRLLDGHSDARLDRNFLTIGTGERMFGTITLDLGEDAQSWAAGLRHA
jgi:hypothetical protein